MPDFLRQYLQRLLRVFQVTVKTINFIGSIVMDQLVTIVLDQQWFAMMSGQKERAQNQSLVQ